MAIESTGQSNYTSVQTDGLSSGSEDEDDPTKMHISVTDVIMTFPKKEKKKLQNEPTLRTIQEEPESQAQNTITPTMSIHQNMNNYAASANKPIVVHSSFVHSEESIE